MTLMEVVNKSGLIGYLILGMSVVSLAIILEKVFTLRLSRIIPEDDLRMLVDFLSGGSYSDAIELCRKRKSAVLKVFLETVRTVGERPRKKEFLGAYEIFAKKLLVELERGMSFLATVSAVAPLLGLTGTVVGMVKIFGVLNGTVLLSSPQQLSAGISQALLTTVMGLLVAIPSIIAYNLFQRKLDKIASELESAGILIAGVLEK